MLPTAIWAACHSRLRSPFPGPMQQMVDVRSIHADKASNLSPALPLRAQFDDAPSAAVFFNLGSTTVFHGSPGFVGGVRGGFTTGLSGPLNGPRINAATLAAKYASSASTARLASILATPWPLSPTKPWVKASTSLLRSFSILSSISYH